MNAGRVIPASLREDRGQYEQQRSHESVRRRSIPFGYGA
jgi:hypothetical protein